MRAHIVDHLRIDTLSRATQGQLAQGGEIAGLEVTADGALGLFRNVDFTFLQALDQIVWRQVDKLDVVSTVENGIWHCFAHAHASDLRHDVVETFEMLNVQCGIDIDTVGQDFLDIQVALGMAAAWGVGVREFVNENQFRFALKYGVEIHLCQHVSLVRQAALGDFFKAFGEQIGFDPAMRFDNADHGVHSVESALTALQQHLISLSDAGCRAKKNLQSTAAFFPSLAKQGFGRWAFFTVQAVICHAAGVYALRRRLPPSVCGIKCHIELQNVDMRFANEAEQSVLDVIGNDLAQS